MAFFHIVPPALVHPDVHVTVGENGGMVDVVEVD
jgi:hypothetical protein